MWCWFVGCPSSPPLPALTGDITCYQKDTCTSVSCCVEVAKFDKRPLEVALDFNQCGNFLDVTVEKITTAVLLTDFKYGTITHIVSPSFVFMCSSTCSISIYFHFCLEVSVFKIIIQLYYFFLFRSAAKDVFERNVWDDVSKFIDLKLTSWYWEILLT